MPPPSTVSDPTDWLLTPLSLLSPLEAALRCQVCKEFFDTPMLTSCSHTFCSLCIRRCLNSDGKCPACRASDQADRLRRNWVVQEVVDAFRAARPAALEVARAGVVLEGNGERQGWGRNKKRKMEDVDADVNMDMEEGGATRRSRRTRRRSRSLELGTSQAEAIEVDDSGDGDYDPDDGTALCPMCKARMKVAAVFAHLDMCTGTKPAGNGAGKGRYVALSKWV
jgi:E3 ubiquitin-protein ligase RAD18